MDDLATGAATRQVISAPTSAGQRGERIDLLVGEHAKLLSERLQAHRAQLFPPDAKRVLRKFTSGEAADLLGPPLLGQFKRMTL